ncbi:MAG: response regulator transcription factor [Pseudomonadales bacterium]|nr:response regulator transcription factor [Pseudomonadales bacterium]
MQVLIVEDDSDLAAAMADYLTLQGAECDFAYNGASGLKLASEESFDVIILDLMLPRMNGFAVCDALRQQGCDTPVLMLTACDTQEDQLEGFRSGIDDFVTKPCAMPILWARLQALYRRNNPTQEIITIGPLTLHPKEHRAEREDQELKLTPTGWKMLECLARHSPNVVTRKLMEETVWKDSEVDTRNFNVQLHQLRKAVDKPFAFPLIHTVVGVGLCLKASD